MAHIKLAIFVTLLTPLNNAYADGITLGDTSDLYIIFLILVAVLAALLLLSIRKAKRLRLDNGESKTRIYLFLLPGVPTLLYPVALIHEAIEFFNCEFCTVLKFDFIYLLITIICGYVFISFMFFFFEEKKPRILIILFTIIIFMAGILIPQSINLYNDLIK